MVTKLIVPKCNGAVCVSAVGTKSTAPADVVTVADVCAVNVLVKANRMTIATNNKFFFFILFFLNS
jgi:hypothetical protein